MLQSLQCQSDFSANSNIIMNHSNSHDIVSNYMCMGSWPLTRLPIVQGLLLLICLYYWNDYLIVKLCHSLPIPSHSFNWEHFFHWKGYLVVKIYCGVSLCLLWLRCTQCLIFVCSVIINIKFLFAYTKLDSCGFLIILNCWNFIGLLVPTL